MTWLFSQALMQDFENSRCSQEQVEEFSADTCSDGEPYAQLNVMPTPHKFWRNDKTMEFSDLSRFGLTLRLLTEDHGAALLTWFREVFLARTSVLLEGELGLMVRAQDSGLNSRGSFVKLDQERRIWRTAQCSLLGDSDEFSQTWPNWGLMRNGECWEVSTAAPITNASEFGFLPTMTARDSRTLAGSQPPHRAPTSGLPLAWTIALTLPPEKRGGGRLNPEWVEWFMGWPMGWTDLKPLAMDKFREWQQQHGGF